MKKIFLLAFFISVSCAFHAQTGTQIGGDTLNLSAPKEYTLVAVYVRGTVTVDSNVIKLISGLPVGDKITVPGEKTSQAIDNIWREGMFDDISLTVDKVDGSYIWLSINVIEKPRICRAIAKQGHGTRFINVKKNDREKLQDKLHLGGTMLTDYRKRFIIETVNEYFRNDGYLNCTCKVIIRDTVAPGLVDIDVVVNKGDRVKVRNIYVDGNDKFSDRKIRHVMKDTKQKRWYNIFHSAKFLEDNYDKDKDKIIAKYQKKGYRDAHLVSDSVIPVSKNRVDIRLNISEGKIYYFGNITWVGNTIYSSKQLSDRLGIKPGDIYNQEMLETRLYMSQAGTDVSSLYMDNGYLFFQVNPVEVGVRGDSIDFEMRIYEGKQATIRNITIRGNTKTNDRVIMREIRTRPGQLFRRSDAIRTQQALASLGYFNPEKIQINPKPDPASGTVDIEYVVEERPSDQVELSGGWGAGRVVGTLGVSFNNFSTHNFFKKDAWTPLPSGDGQKLSIRAQSNGLYYQSYNASFTEPWLGGKKPNSLSFTLYQSVQSNGLKRSDPLNQHVRISGFTVGFGKRLKKPDDYFQIYFEQNYQYYELHNFYSVFAFADGYANDINWRVTLERNSLDQMIFPRSGSDIKVIGEFTPPYSLLNGKDYSDLSLQQRYKWLEFYKWKFTSSWFTRLAGNLVLNTRIGFGYLGMYNSKVGVSPFERFYLGGGGLTGYALDGREIIALRGYDDQSLTTRSTGSPIIAKYTWELRYPVSLNPSATVYGLAFVEAGNTWDRFKDFNPFDVYRSAGVGVRVFLPMFGLLGLDWGYRFDDVANFPGMQRSQVHFTLGFNLGEL